MVVKWGFSGRSRNSDHKKCISIKIIKTRSNRWINSSEESHKLIHNFYECCVCILFFWIWSICFIFIPLIFISWIVSYLYLENKKFDYITQMMQIFFFLFSYKIYYLLKVTFFNLTRPFMNTQYEGISRMCEFDIINLYYKTLNSNESKQYENDRKLVNSLKWLEFDAQKSIS